MGLLSGIGSILGGFGAIHGAHSADANSAAAIASQEHINEQQLEWASEQSALQVEMANTQYQRAVEDMQKAGINPIYASKVGGNAMPSTVGAPNLGNPHSAGASAFSSTASGYSGMSQALSGVASAAAGLDRLNLDSDKIIAETEKVKTEIENLDVSRNLSEKQIDVLSETVAKIRSEIDLNVNRAIEASASSGLKSRQSEGVFYDNVEKQIMADFFYSSEPAKIAKEMGISSSVLKGLVAAVQSMLKKGK